MIRQIISVIVFVMMGLMAAFAQAPSSTLSYQSVVRDAQNRLVINQSVSVTVNIKCGGTLTYSEEHSGLQTNENGVLSFRIGSGAPAAGTWADITWNNATIQTITTWTDGSTTSEDVPVTAVPYALQSDNISDVSSFAATAGDNTFTGINTVPGSFDLHTTNSTNCGNLVANACDLYAVFDSLNRRVDNINDTVEQVSNALAALKDDFVASFTLSVSQTGDGIVRLCGDPSVDVTYTAIPNGGREYTYSWSGSPVSTNDNTATYTYSSDGTYTVTVTATHNTPSFTLTATISTTVVSGGTKVYISLCENDHTVVVKNVGGNPNSISWGDGETETLVEADMNHTYSTDGIYTVTVSNSDECVATKQVAIGNYTLHPCTGTANTTGSGNGEDGKETADANGDIISVKDYDGNEYPVVKIGSQCWMAVNLRTTHYASGKAVPTGTSGSGSNTAAFFYDFSSSGIPLVQRGYLYNWTATMDSVTTEGGQGVCPTGWHVPTKVEWQTMVVAADASTSTGAVFLASSCYWNGLTEATDGMTPNSYYNQNRNKSGFSAVGTGYYRGTSFIYAGVYAYFWSSSIYKQEECRSVYRNMSSSVSGIRVYNSDKWETGFSVRCVRDE